MCVETRHMRAVFKAQINKTDRDAETKRKALENGAEALLTKPIDFGTLRSEIETRVERAA